MNTYAIIDNDGNITGIEVGTRVINLPNYILVDNNFDLSYKKYVDGEWVDTPKPRKTILSKFDFYQRLTIDEKAMLLAPEHIPNIPSQAIPILRVFANEINVADEIDLDLESMIMGLDQLVKMGLITKERMDEIRGINANK